MMENTDKKKSLIMFSSVGLLMSTQNGKQQAASKSKKVNIRKIKIKRQKGKDKKLQKIARKKKRAKTKLKNLIHFFLQQKRRNDKYNFSPLLPTLYPASFFLRLT